MRVKYALSFYKVPIIPILLVTSIENDSLHDDICGNIHFPKAYRVKYQLVSRLLL